MLVSEAFCKSIDVGFSRSIMGREEKSIFKAIVHCGEN
jgi:hypothetical protein